MNDLYKDCIEFYSNYLGKSYYVYAPKNELDMDLFNNIIHSDTLKHKNIVLDEEVDDFSMTFYFDEQHFVGNINYLHPRINICSECKFIVPFDYPFYSNKTQKELDDVNNGEDSDDQTFHHDKYNVCLRCYKNSQDGLGNATLNLVNETSGLDNLSDWVHVFEIKRNYIDEHYTPISDSYDFFCNLNKNSRYYKQFAINEYEYMCGNYFDIIEETTLEEIVKKYNKST